SVSLHSPFPVPRSPLVGLALGAPRETRYAFAATEGPGMGKEAPNVASQTPAAAPTDVRAAWERFHASGSPAAKPSIIRRLAPYRVILFFLAGLLSLDILVHAARAIWNAYDPDDYLERLEGCRNRPHDLVLLGGSPMSEGVDPDVL